MIELNEIKNGAELLGLDEACCAAARACAEEINSCCIEAFEKTEKMIFGNPEWKYTDIIPYYGSSVEKLFGCPVPQFTTSLFIILCSGALIKNQAGYGFPDEIRAQQLKGLQNYFANSYKSHPEGITLPQFIWCVRLLSGRHVNINRLQFEYFEDKESESIIHVHIPGGKKLDIDEVKLSFKNAVSFFEEKLGLKRQRYECASWLLSPEVIALCKKESNMRLFYDLFDVTPGPDCRQSLLTCVFKLEKCDDYSTLPEETSLQRSVKEALITGKPFHTGLGVVKPEYL